MDSQANADFWGPSASIVWPAATPAMRWQPPPGTLTARVPRLVGVSDYELLVELAAKGLAQRDSRPMPKSVVTPEDFYDIMARSALDAIGLRGLLEDLARAEQELGSSTNEMACPPEDAKPFSALPEDPTVFSWFAPDQLAPAGSSVIGAGTRGGRATQETESARCSRSEWAARAQGLLAVVTAAVERLRSAFEGEPAMRSESSTMAAELLSACNGLSEWLISTRVPKGLARAEAELGAAVGVYGNVAVVFGSLNEAEADQRRARWRACCRLLEQGDDHLALFARALAKKVRGGASLDRGSIATSRMPGTEHS